MAERQAEIQELASRRNAQLQQAQTDIATLEARAVTSESQVRMAECGIPNFSTIVNGSSAVTRSCADLFCNGAISSPEERA